jgi:hypothetical protein
MAWSNGVRAEVVSRRRVSEEAGVVIGRSYLLKHSSMTTIHNHLSTVELTHNCWRPGVIGCYLHCAVCAQRPGCFHRAIMHGPNPPLETCDALPALWPSMKYTGVYNSPVLTLQCLEISVVSSMTASTVSGAGSVCGLTYDRPPQVHSTVHAPNIHKSRMVPMEGRGGYSAMCAHSKAWPFFLLHTLFSLHTLSSAFIFDGVSYIISRNHILVSYMISSSTPPKRYFSFLQRCMY